MGSDLVLSICHICAGLYKVLWVTSRYNVTPKMLNKSVKVMNSDQKWPIYNSCSWSPPPPIPYHTHPPTYAHRTYLCLFSVSERASVARVLTNHPKGYVENVV